MRFLNLIAALACAAGITNALPSTNIRYGNMIDSFPNEAF